MLNELQGGPRGPDFARATETAVLPSRATAVTFFEDRAEVVRLAKVTLGRGAQWIGLAGVSPFVDERTVVARVATGHAVVNAARVRWHVHGEAALGREEMEKLRAEEQVARRTVEDAGRARARADRRIDQINALYTKWAADAAKVAAGVRDPARLAAWRSAWGALTEAVHEAHRAIGASNEERERAERTAERALLRLHEGTITSPRFEARIEVDAEAVEDGEEVEIEVQYRVPGALWRPEHLMRFIAKTEKSAGATVEIVTWATVWHAAGESWEGVRARFSTARPARDAAPPLVRDDVLHLRRKTAEERSRVMVETREQTIQAAGIDRGTRAVDEMPGVDDGGEPLTLEAMEPLTLASSGHPLRVEVSRRTLPAEVDRILYPEFAGAAHLRATLTLSGAPLLAGPVRVARGAGVVGRSKIAFVGSGEPFEIGFGADDGVRARRHVEEQRDTTAIIGTQKIRRRVDVFLSNLSDETKALTVTERVPVSEIEDVEITMIEAADFSAKDPEGFLRAKVSLTPHETRRLSFSYEIRAGSNVVLPF